MRIVTSRIAAIAVVGLALASCAPRPGSDVVHIPTLAPDRQIATAPPRPVPLVGGEAARPSAEPRGRKKGDRIRVEWHGQQYPAVVLGVAPGGLTRIHYEGYGDEWDEEVGEDRISPADDDALDE
jgi:hypothetical protein